MGDFSERIGELKRKLETEHDLGAVSRFFFDHLAEDPAFMAACPAVGNPPLKSTIAALAEEVDEAISGADCMTMLMRYRELPFIHGSVFVGGWIGSVIYFEDIGKGCLGLMKGVFPEMHYLRFSTGAPP